MGKTFQRIRLCSVGKLRDADKIPQWVRAHGGEYTKTVDPRTTHLVATKEAYKENVQAGTFIQPFHLSYDLLLLGIEN